MSTSNKKIRFRGTGTWNDEEYLTLTSQNTVERKHRIHLRAKDPLSDLEYINLASSITNPTTPDSQRKLAEAVKNLAANETLDVVLDDIAVKLEAGQPTDWTLAVIKDTSQKDGLNYYFEIWKEF